jgi:hypothetical protein
VHRLRNLEGSCRLPLPEAYYGNPYATRIVVPEAFEQDGARTKAATLRERFPKALRAAEQREHDVYDTTDAEDIEHTLNSFRTS